ncbi:MAG: hypothetical protein K2Y71_12115 [Xanthobacteraceae bacterium]|nr:hypothetical protein [Xanthobacteraceae bacterium]
MHPETLLLLAIVGLIVAYGFGCAYRLAWATVSDAILLVVMTGAAMGAAYLFG